MCATVCLRAFRKANSLTQENLAAYLGTTDSFISQVENGRVNLPEDKIQKLLDNDKGWDTQPLLKSTKGPMTKSCFPEEGLGDARVRLIPFEARGGMIGDFVDGVHDYDCESVISPIKGVDFAMTVTGDSMMPEYNPGDRILIKRIDPNIFIEWGRVYVLDTPNGAVLKKLMKTDDPEYVQCVSLNPDVQPFVINVSDVRGWYRVLMVMSMK